MGLFDKFNKDDLIAKAKSVAGSATETVKNTVNNAKAGYEQKKAEQAAHNSEMEEKAAVKAQEIINAIKEYDNGCGVFDKVSEEELLSFTKEFYDKIFMPANSVSKSIVSMHPYIDAKQLEKATKELAEYDSSETPIVLIKAENHQLILITDKSLYFKLSLEEDAKFFASGRIPCSEVNRFSVEMGDTTSSFRCDEFVLATFTTSKVTTEDFITLDNYFRCIETRDFEITDEEVDKLIRQKIGDKVMAEIKKYMVYDDEQLVYFAWGLDSLSAKDYLVCTDKQIIIVDREMFGATANIRQFYYEDITSASVVQNSNNADLTGFLIETAITAATKTCDLILTVAGATIRINTLFKVEAERVVAVYHQFRKSIKTASSQPQVVVQQAACAADPIEQIKKLKDMLDIGIISQEEFDQKKAELLSKL
ncbi:MAG: SHOCT domain-containing protein [Clostridia bacterium]|nr:SHOCT domain-containing protein [Clostridia bacterium]